MTSRSPSPAHRIRFLAVLGALALAAGAGAALGQDKPAPEARPVSDIRDQAGLFSADAIREAKARLERSEREFQIPTVIESVNSLEGRTAEGAAARGLEQLDRTAIFILLAKRETKIEVLVSGRLDAAAYAPLWTSIRDVFMEELRQRHFDDAILKGALAVEAALKRARAEAPPDAFDRARRNVGAGRTTSPLVVRDQVRLTLAGARKIVEGAEAKATALALKVNIAVVDDGGHLLNFARMDGARPASGYTAITKATTAATFRQATGPLPTGTTAPDPLLNLSLQNAAAASGGKITTLSGGIPVVVEGQVVGGVGVGGGSGEQDATVARAGVEAFLGGLTAAPDAGETNRAPAAKPEAPR